MKLVAIPTLLCLIIFKKNWICILIVRSVSITFFKFINTRSRSFVHWNIKLRHKIYPQGILNTNIIGEESGEIHKSRVSILIWWQTTNLKVSLVIKVTFVYICAILETTQTYKILTSYSYSENVSYRLIKNRWT